MYSVRTSNGFSTNACTLDDALDWLGQHCLSIPEPNRIGWVISTYGNQTWTGDLDVPAGHARQQLIADQLGRINARLVLSYLGGLMSDTADSRLHTPLAG